MQAPAFVGAEACAILEGARDTFPTDYDISWGLTTRYRDMGRTADARAEANRLLTQYADDPNIRSLLESLQVAHSVENKLESDDEQERVDKVEEDSVADSSVQPHADPDSDGGPRRQHQ